MGNPITHAIRYESGILGARPLANQTSAAPRPAEPLNLKLALWEGDSDLDELACG